MAIKIGEVEALFRYPVKSMGGEPVEDADLGWHGLDGDRRLALSSGRRPGRLSVAIRRQTSGADSLHSGTLNGGGLPTHVRTPEGDELELFSEELASEVGRRHRAPVEMMHLKHGIFDEASVSFTAATVEEIGRLAGQQPNILIASLRSVPFEEDEWVGGVLSFGEDSEAAAIGVPMRDERCAMVNFDPDSARSDAAVLKAIVRERDNKAGVYGAVTRRGRLAVGQPILFEPATEHRKHR